MLGPSPVKAGGGGKGTGRRKNHQHFLRHLSNESCLTVSVMVHVQTVCSSVQRMAMEATVRMCRHAQGGLLVWVSVGKCER